MYFLVRTSSHILSFDLTWSPAILSAWHKATWFYFISKTFICSFDI